MTVAVRMPAALAADLKRVAVANERTFSQELRVAAKAHIAKAKES